jgi:hypothetical protein
MTNIEPTSRKEFETDVNALCRLPFILYGNPNKPMEPEGYVFLEKHGKFIFRIVNNLLARHHPRKAHPENNPNYDEWHKYARIKWLDALYRVLELRYTKLTR